MQHLQALGTSFAPSTSHQCLDPQFPVAGACHAESQPSTHVCDGPSCSTAPAEQRALLQIWLELYNDPTQLEKDTLDAVFTAWFTLGRCGGFNAQNLQVHIECTVITESVATAVLCPKSCASGTE